jgi:hypothetical protein
MDIRVMLLKDKLHTNNETKKVAKIWKLKIMSER